MKTPLEELRKMDDAKLRLHIGKLEADLFKTKLEVKANQSKNIHHIPLLKLGIARANTLISERANNLT